MASIKQLKHVCDRCGNSVVKDDQDEWGNHEWYPQDWQHINLGQTGANLDLCAECNEDLFLFLSAKEADSMDKACFNKREVI